MKYETHIILALVVVISLHHCCDADTVPPSADEVSKNETKQICKRSMMLLAKRVVRNLKPCNTEMKKKYPNKDDYQKHFQCKVKCVMQQLQIVDENYMLSNATVEAFLKANMPPAAHDYLTMVGKDCNDSWAPRLGPKTGELCLEYGEYFKCLQGVLGDCDPDKLN